MFFQQRFALTDHTPDRELLPGCRHDCTGLGPLGVKCDDFVAGDRVRLILPHHGEVQYARTDQNKQGDNHPRKSVHGSKLFQCYVEWLFILPV